MTTTCTPPSVFGAAIDQRLDVVWQRFTAELHSDLTCVNELAGYVEAFRGKMLRPALVLASARAVHPSQRWDDPAALETVAAVVEMVHMATLVHDDVLDDAAMRRRGATINRLHGNEAAVMLGDYLISHAYHLCCSLDPDRAWVSRAIAKATNTTCEGELLQLANRGNWELNETTYFEIVRRKTGRLCAVACELGARLNGASDEQARVLFEFGETLGTAFQIADDVIDLRGDPATVGKTLGLDLVKGKLTLPLILWLGAMPAGERRAAIGVLEHAASPDLNDRQNAEALARLREGVERCGAVDRALAWARDLVADQAQALAAADVPEAGVRDLMGLARLAVERSQ